MDIKIRLAEEKDIKNIADIEAECFTTPETESSVRSVIENYVYEAFVAEVDNEIVGHTITMSAVGDMDILSVAVRPVFRKMGIGQKLLENLLTNAYENDIYDVFLEVRKSNIAARSLYEKMGFEKIGERKNFYDLPREDAVLMKKTIKEVM